MTQAMQAEVLAQLEAEPAAENKSLTGAVQLREAGAVVDQVQTAVAR
jgi:hypothetical protein